MGNEFQSCHIQSLTSAFTSSLNVFKFPDYSLFVLPQVSSQTSRTSVTTTLSYFQLPLYVYLQLSASGKSSTNKVVTLPIVVPIPSDRAGSQRRCLINPSGPKPLLLIRFSTSPGRRTILRSRCKTLRTGRVKGKLERVPTTGDLQVVTGPYRQAQQNASMTSWNSSTILPPQPPPYSNARHLQAPLFVSERDRRAVSPSSMRSGRPLASSPSSMASSNWGSSSAFIKYSTGSAKSVSTTATSVGSNGWRNGSSKYSYETG